MIIALSEGGITGFGEATTNPYYGITYGSLERQFREIARYVHSYPFQTPEKLWEDLLPVAGGNTFAQSAMDCAAHDLYYKSRGSTLRSQWGIIYEKYPLTSYTLGIGSLDELKRKIMDLPWPIYKLKVAGKNDGTLLRGIRDQTSALIRIDANCAWHPEDASRLANELYESGVEFIEQPFAAEEYEATRSLRKICPVPVIADESCRKIEDLEKCAGAFDGINIKLAKCGGLTPAIRMIEIARKKGLKIMIGCMTETTIGIAAAAQLLPFVDYADLDGPLLLSEDVATGLKYHKGSVCPGKSSGLGFEFKYNKFRTDLPV